MPLPWLNYGRVLLEFVDPNAKLPTKGVRPLLWEAISKNTGLAQSCKARISFLRGKPLRNHGCAGGFIPGGIPPGAGPMLGFRTLPARMSALICSSVIFAFLMNIN